MKSTPLTQTKDIRIDLRKEFRRKRRCLSNAEQKIAACNIAEKIAADIHFNHIKHVAVYLANDGEIDLSIFVKDLWQQGKSTYLPVLDHNNLGKLLFAPYSNKTLMIQNKYGISEPDVTAAQMCPIERLDIVFTPLVAFDWQGNRLGMGGGYYDRTLASLDSKQRSVQLIGVAHSCQQTESLDQQSWDIPMDKIVTDQQVIVTSF